MYLPQRPNMARQPVSRARSLPPPVGGWNARDALSDMGPEYAVVLDNLIPGNDAVYIRRGARKWATGLSNVESLMSYEPPAGVSRKLFAAAEGSVYDATAEGLVGAPVLTGYLSSRWQHANFGTSAGHFIVMVNGSDAGQRYDGTTWSALGVTGPADPTKLVHVNVFKRRLFFVEDNSLSFWYLPVEAITGAAVEFSLASEVSEGGELVAMATWSRDSGDGLDDLAVFLTSRGEAIIYQGTDPSNAVDWRQVGVFKMGEPIGRRCFEKIGGELIVITEAGYYPLSKAIAAAETQDAAAISDLIRNAVTSAARRYEASFGWDIAHYPHGDLLIVNVPTAELVSSEQHVMHTNTGRWCRFTGWNAICWAIHDDRAYYGAPDGVALADDGQSDAGNNITIRAQQAYFHLDGKRQATAHLVRPVLRSDGDFTLSLRVNVDYSTDIPTDTTSFLATPGAEWDTATWDESFWAGADQIIGRWYGATGTGYAHSLYLIASMRDITARWFSTDWVYEPGGYL